MSVSYLSILVLSLCCILESSFIALFPSFNISQAYFIQVPFLYIWWCVLLLLFISPSTHFLKMTSLSKFVIFSWPFLVVILSKSLLVSSSTTIIWCSYFQFQKPFFPSLFSSSFISTFAILHAFIFWRIDCIIILIIPTFNQFLMPLKLFYYLQRYLYL